MKFTKWVTLTALVFLVSPIIACSASAPQTCTLTAKFTINIVGAKNDPSRTVSELNLQIVDSSRGLVLNEADKPMVQNWITANRAKVAIFNDTLKTLFGTLPDYVAIPQMPDELIPGYQFSPNWRGYQCSDHLEANLSFYLAEDTKSKYGYVTSLRLDESDAFVTVTSPKGSQVAFKFPASMINDALTSALGGNIDKAKEAVTLNYNILSPTVSIGRANLEEALIQGLIDSRDNGIEAVSFTINAGDFEGRTVLKSVIARALQIAASGRGKVDAVLNGYLSNGATTISSVRIDTNGIKAGGFWILATGAISATGGDSHYAQTSQTTIDDVIRGSIYLSPAK